jgi:hypothetical protein
MEPIRISTQQAYLYTMLFTAAVGFAVGLVPLILGIVKKKLKLGVLGLVASTIGGGLLGLLLAVPAAIVFIWLILKKPASNGVSSVDDSPLT